MTERLNGVGRVFHPAAGEEVARFDVSGRERVLCVCCGHMEVASNGLLCLYDINQPDIRGWYEEELRGRNIEADLDPVMEQALKPIISPPRSSPWIEEMERRASSPRIPYPPLKTDRKA